MNTRRHIDAHRRLVTFPALASLHTAVPVMRRTQTIPVDHGI
ncbi:hypothetical protein [Acetobacter sicerae]|nr:hypothetical protein [Acetobacter sicerae]